METVTDQARKPRVVIVGGGFGGLEVARALRDTAVDITLIDRNNHHLFQPLLYQVATAGLSPADIASPIRNILRRQSNVEVEMGEVVGVDVNHRAVLLSNKQIDYDYLVLATGAQDSYFGHDEWAKSAPGLKSIPQATEIRRDILVAFEKAEMETDDEKKRALLTFVLVGGGPTGVEMAGAIAELAHKALAADFRHIDPRMARIILVEAGPRILASFSEDLSAKAKQALEQLGVEVWQDKRVEAVDETSVTVAGERIATTTVIWAAGVKASPAGKWIGAEVDKAGRIKVNDDCRIPNHPEIFAIGDTATMQQNGKPLPGVAPVAMQQGRYVAKVIKSRLENIPVGGPFHYTDKGNLATVGRAYAVLETGKIKLHGLIAWLAWLGIHIFFLIGFRNRLLVIVQWAWAYISYQRGARLITVPLRAGDQESDLTLPPAPLREPVGK